MIRCATKSVVLGFFLCTLVPRVDAQSLLPELYLDVYNLLNQSPTVRSLARATVYDRNGNRAYNAEVILGHELWDSTVGAPLYTAHVVTYIGYANSGTGKRPALEEHCYSARMSAHVNAYNLHEYLQESWQCVPDSPEDPEIPEENCPVLLDLEMDGFHLSGLDPAVSFDIDADGTADQIAWTRSEDDDALLCMDRNRNGVIDDGSELFGYATPLLSGEHARIGYRALADLDRFELGGNADGKIDASDVLFHNLCVWTDRNRDGVSDEDEIRSAEASGVISLQYEYRTTKRRDSFGNLFRYVARAEMLMRPGKVRSWPTYDVIFAEAEQ
jgi:hypothetical protein